MHTKIVVQRSRCVLGTVALACALLTGTAVADEHTVVVGIPVSGKGLHLSNPADARELYQRLNYAAYVACTRADRVGLAPSPDPRGCSEKALADAVRSANMPLLTQAYLETHTAREAMTSGIKLPPQMAAK
jgi:UrcA family protein